MALLCAAFHLNWDFFCTLQSHSSSLLFIFWMLPRPQAWYPKLELIDKKNRMGTNYFRFRLAKCDITATFQRPIHSFELQNMNQTWYSIFFSYSTKKYFAKYYISHFAQRKFCGFGCCVGNFLFAPSHFVVICIRLQSHEVRNIYYLSTALSLFRIYKTIGNGTKAIRFDVYSVSEKISNNIRHMAYTHICDKPSVWSGSATHLQPNIMRLPTFFVVVIVIVVVSFERQKQIGKSLSTSQFYAENGKYRFVKIACESCTCVQTS